MTENVLRFIKKFIPKRLFNALSPVYHWLMAFLSALIYRFPSRRIFIVGVTGTKGKTSVLEIMNAIFEEARYNTALASTLRFKIGNESERNKEKMTMPGRFFMQRFLRNAVKKKCQYAFIEMTSQGVLQFRHKFMRIDAMIFTNLAPEHIESHGSFEKYREAKQKFFKALEKSKKKKRVIVVNKDDDNAEYFLHFKAEEIWCYGLNNDIDAEDFIKKIEAKDYQLLKDGTDFYIDGHRIRSRLLGEFNLYNILAAIALARSQMIGWDSIKTTLEKFSGIPGRVQFVDEGQDFKIVVDYAHTPESLTKLYELFQTSHRICVLGATGGGRDKWKRKELGKIASVHCDDVILTNEDPYDESPMEIVGNMAEGMESPFKYKIIMNRREAIREALKIAQTGDAVLITGKGTDPWIMGPRGTKIKWDDGEVVREELKKIREKKREKRYD